MTRLTPRPLLFLDLDDTLCLNERYGGIDVHRAIYSSRETPADLFERLFASEAVTALNQLLMEFEPEVILTTSWLSLLQREHFVELFRRTGLSKVADSLHLHWDAASDRGVSRLDAIDAWLRAHHTGQSVLILDDVNSGESLIGSFHAETGRALLCDGERGFHRDMLDEARRALVRPYFHGEPWR